MPHSSKTTTAAEDVYARALLELAEAQSLVPQIADEVSQLAELIQTQPGLRKLLDSRVLAGGERATIVENLFKGKVHDLLYRFLQVVNKKNRLAQLPEIARAFGRLVDEKYGKAEIDVWVPRELPGDQAQTVARRIGAVLNREVQLNQHVDPALVGGIRIRVGDQLIDGSIAAQLRMIRQNLIATGREKARQITESSMNA